MRNKPIEVGYHGCLNCSHISKTLDGFCRNGFGSVNITFGFFDPISKNIGETVTCDLTKIDVEYFTYTSIQAVNKHFKKQLDENDFSEIRIDTPLHDETYEYNKDDGIWYLTRQGQGFA